MNLLRSIFRKRKPLSGIGFIILIFAISVSYLFFIFDIGIASERFARRDFNKAFHARMTGDCDKFSQYVVLEYSREWFERCLDEKRGGSSSILIGNFIIKGISVNGDKAFLQVALTRRIPREEDSNYDVSYEMKRENKREFLGFLPLTRFIISQGINR